MIFPEVLPVKASPAWATYIGGRKPEFKAHSHIGLAKTALAYHGLNSGYYTPRSEFTIDMGLYHVATLDGEPRWVLHTLIKSGTSKKDYPEIWKT